MIGYLTTIAALVLIASLVGLGLNMQWGVVGLVNFGVVGFFALGAYVTAIVDNAGAGPFGGLAAAAIACAAASALLALLSTRLEDDYLAIVTIGFGEVVRLVTLNETWLTGEPSESPISSARSPAGSRPMPIRICFSCLQPQRSPSCF